MTNTFQFVDSIAASPTLRLDINDVTTWLVSADGTDLSPPPMRRSVVSTMLRDGELIAAGAYGNRTLTIVLELQAATQDLAWTATQALWRELNRPTNILKVQLGTVPVFFRTYRAPDAVLEMVAGRVEYQRLTLTIPAEPFAYGLKETQGLTTIPADPSLTNGFYFDVASVKGDVETPLIMTLPAMSGDVTMAIGVRRRGTPSATPFVLQAESATTLGADTTLPGNDVNMSGAGSNYTRTTFATSTALQLRARKTTHPATGSVDARGTYRVFGRFRSANIGDVINARLVWGPTASLANDTVTITTNAAKMRDLGIVSIPGTPDPIQDGLSGIDLEVDGTIVDVQLERVSVGATTCDIDYLLFVPADDSFGLFSWNALSGPTSCVIDGTRQRLYALSAAGRVAAIPAATVAGGFPMVSPGVTNRVFWIYSMSGTPTSAWTVTPSYYPRYLLVPGS